MKRWTNEEHNYLVELKLNNYPWKEIAERMTQKFGEEYTAEQCRGRWRINRHKIVNEVDPIAKFGVKKKRDRKTGIEEVERLVAISNMENADDAEVLQLHGYNPNKWSLIDHQFSMWDHLNKKMENPKTLYASKVRVEPKKDILTDEEILSAVTSETKPLKIKTTKYKTDNKRMLGIELMDMHFGINTLDDYQDTIRRLTERLESRKWDRVAITFGSDLMHVDNLKNTTANQTRIDDVDIVQMIEDVKTFYEYLVTKASEQANEVKVIYIKGNHDETTSALLIHWLDARFRDTDNVEVDTTIQEVKVYTWEKIFVALTHGDKGGKRTKNTLSTNYPLEWARSKVREFHKGHLHHEKALDEFGITERILPTGAKTDQYHKDNSFDSAHKRFMIFEYSSEWLESIHYV